MYFEMVPLRNVIMRSKVIIITVHHPLLVVITLMSCMRVTIRIWGE
jgi:hypothetical protein